MTLQAVIFDYGMVLSTAREPSALLALQQITRLDDAAFDEHYWRHRHRYDLGELDGPGFWGAIGRDAALALTPLEIERLIEHDVLMWSTLNEPMIRWAAALQDAGLRTAILSNMPAELVLYLRQEFGWLGRFDHHSWSSEIRIAKPDPAIYRYTCEKLGVAPEAALFLDDKPENIAAAEAVGLQAILFTTPEALEPELKRRGLADNLPAILAAPSPA